MKHISMNVNLKIYKDMARHGAPYTMDGVHYFNHGDMVEIVVKSCLGFEARKDGNARFDSASDIMEMRASVKSARATLTSAQIGNDFNSILNAYFCAVHSTTWIYARVDDGICDMYIMDAREFRAFVNRFGYYCNARNVIRLKDDNKKMTLYFKIRAH